MRRVILDPVAGFGFGCEDAEGGGVKIRPHVYPDRGLDMLFQTSMPGGVSIAGTLSGPTMIGLNASPGRSKAECGQHSHAGTRRVRVRTRSPDFRPAMKRTHITMKLQNTGLKKNSKAAGFQRTRKRAV